MFEHLAYYLLFITWRLEIRPVANLPLKAGRGVARHWIRDGDRLLRAGGGGTNGHDISCGYALIGREGEIQGGQGGYYGSFGTED